MIESPVRIAPSVLSADFGRLAAEVQAVTQAGADLIHCDVMDGHFVPNLTMGPIILRAIRKATHLPLDVHLMIEEPERWVEAYAAAGADIIYVHPESCVHLHRVVQQIRAAGKQPGVALNPATSLSTLEHILPELSTVLLMSVNPGFGGQSFIPFSLEKIATLHGELVRRGLVDRVSIAVDGGITVENCAHVVRAGARVLVSGTGVFGTADYRATIATFHERTAAALPAAR